MHCCLRFVYQSQSIFTILNSDTKVLAKTPCKTLKQMAKNKNALFLTVGRF